jgi:hypothetical protein
MRPNQSIRCEEFACQDVRHESYYLVDFDLEPDAIHLLVVAEAAPARPEDGFYAGNQALFWQTTQLAFQDAGYNFQSTGELLQRGVYLTTMDKI